MQRFQFHPAVAGWFERQFGTPTEPQERGWPAIQSGAHTLIAAPTGSGKTLAAFFASLDGLFRSGLEGTLRDETRVLYVSPLKALSNDIHKNLELPLAGIRAAILASEGRDIEVRAEVRTGDTPASKRLAISKKPPHLLVTTPESFYLLLTSESGRRLLSTVRALIVDEIHAVAGNRRGSHLALSMERLSALTGHRVQRIGISATQKPIEQIARFLVGSAGSGACEIIDTGHKRALDLAIELPGSPLEAVMSNEVWAEIYGRLSELIQEHRTTLVFVNTRRLAERVAHQLCERLGKDQVASHHGSLSAKLRLDAENRLKRGELRALVATASLELGIDIGSVDLVCQIGTTRSISTCLQRVGRAEHQRGGLPKGRLFPLTRDELVECAATLRCVRRGELDALHIPEKPLDVLAQQIVACTACEDWQEEKLFDLVRAAYPYRSLQRQEFDEVVRMLAEGFSTKRGRRAALIHHDAVNHRVRGRRGSRLLALTSGGAIPDNGDYRVVLEPAQTFIGTVNEDFAVESMAGDIFQLGNASWKILGINSGTVRVEDAHGQPPGIPFWLGEAPARTEELSRAVSEFREECEKILKANSSEDCLLEWLETEGALPGAGARQLANYFSSSWKVLGTLPSRDKLVMERFFDESGGMQLVIHSPFGARLNRAWGLALRKRFCRSFNFELQSAATDDAIVLSLGTQHSFPLAEVFHYLHSKTVREILVQALLDAPMFPIRWRWNATRSLALPRHRAGHKVPAPLQRMESENLLAAVFPDQLACLENIAGDREIPDHPLVRQTIEDCLTEAMDIEALEALLRRIENGEIECIARDLPEPSTLAHEILNARPYAFLDNAPLEERRTQAVYTRRASESEGLGILDAAAIERVCAEAWPRASNADELHEALLLLGVVTEEEAQRCCRDWQEDTASLAPETKPMELADSNQLLDSLAREKRAGRLTNIEAPPTPGVDGNASARWVAAERLPLLGAVYPGSITEPLLQAPEADRNRSWERADAVRELLRGRMEAIGPTTAKALADYFVLRPTEIDAALLALEAEGFVLRGKFHPGASEMEWCDRRLLARIHGRTINRLRAEIQPVSIAEFQRFLLAWQRVSPEHRAEGPEGLEAVLAILDGYELPAAAWEPAVLAARVKDYSPEWLDRLCFAGRIGWGRLSASRNPKARAFAPVRSSPVALFSAEHLSCWLELSGAAPPPTLSPDTELVRAALVEGGALFFREIVRRTRLLPSRVEQALGELAGLGLIASDSFEGLRALLVPAERRSSSSEVQRRGRHAAVTSLEFAGRWSLLRAPAKGAHSFGDQAVQAEENLADGSDSHLRPEKRRDEAVETYARVLLRRYGIVFRRLMEREVLGVTWFELGRAYRRLEARGEIRGGYFVSGVSGEQFALPEAIGLLRSLRKAELTGELITLSAADPLNLAGILTPGPRITAIWPNRLLLRNGVPVAALEGGKILRLENGPEASDDQFKQLLQVGHMPAALRRYYG